MASTLERLLLLLVVAAEAGDDVRPPQDVDYLDCVCLATLEASRPLMLHSISSWFFFLSFFSMGQFLQGLVDYKKLQIEMSSVFNRSQPLFVLLLLQ
jgi:hypothetical protein